MFDPSCAFAGNSEQVGSGVAWGSATPRVGLCPGHAGDLCRLLVLICRQLTAALPCDVDVHPPDLRPALTSFMACVGVRGSSVGLLS